MLEAVFISDLHLHPDVPAITHRFNDFMQWAAANARTLYILGDFFHAWPGDDSIDEWSSAIASTLAQAASQGLTIYYLHGNRDFLLGQRFATTAGMTLLRDPSLITLGGVPVLLTHGDRYCTLDKAHQRFRRLTRNRLFTALFLKLPLSYRNQLVSHIRQRSQQNRNKDEQMMDVVANDVLKHLYRCGVQQVIHGHTHKPGLSRYHYGAVDYYRYVLSDWDDTPKILCYDQPKGFEFIQPIR
ncbi:UDP-2,3-diacylglucosamine hydrolase [Legionella rubrilucens]|uniref:UDP-2,3-diacylglucosamine hydrolase n=1 Tax=Legionella rubrilucens TaxID=458 RepID=A0A0W0Y6H3_9GAMM|nr:UDP-2,3-diacylglucosamine diphosphatase [Legionella rubrilucens]KTD52453.1 UDP-2,3-diacylglucosamine hydrolase [Legionella rubrilucens]